MTIVGLAIASEIRGKAGFSSFCNTFVSVLQCSTEAFPGVRSARKEVV